MKVGKEWRGNCKFCFIPKNYTTNSQKTPKMQYRTYNSVKANLLAFLTVILIVGWFCSFKHFADAQRKAKLDAASQLIMTSDDHKKINEHTSSFSNSKRRAQKSKPIKLAVRY